MNKKAKTGIEEFAAILEGAQSTFDKSKNLSTFVERIILDSGLEEHYVSKDEIDGTQRKQNLQELANSAIPYECTMEGLLAFLDAINLDRSLELASDEEDTDAVTLITLHNTKGLEFKNVIITGLENGIFPREDKWGDELEEERRLFYVAITRAKDSLYITSCAIRRLYGHIQPMMPSRFLLEAGETLKPIGNIPRSYKNHFGSDDFDDEDYEEDEKAEILETWKKGTNVYHDDYGYGQIIKASVENGEVLILVKFETGNVKKFLPEYQKNKLDIIKE